MHQQVAFSKRKVEPDNGSREGAGRKEEERELAYDSKSPRLYAVTYSVRERILLLTRILRKLEHGKGLAGLVSIR
jgi:hypothetical protein